MKNIYIVIKFFFLYIFQTQIQHLTRIAKFKKKIGPAKDTVRPFKKPIKAQLTKDSHFCRD